MNDPRDNLPEWWPECPYPDDLFPMTIEEYIRAVPDPKLRTSISGLLYRCGWNVASKQIFQALREEVAGRFKIIKNSLMQQERKEE
jgi:hypothetical protein